jgi:nitrogenase subunit NifH
VDAGAHTRIDTGLGVKGESVLKYAPDSQAAKAYRQLAREVLNGKKI